MAAWTAWRREMNRSILRTIRAWAGTHERCPLAGCRRNGRCLDLDDCRYVDPRQYTEEENAAFRRQIREALDAAMARREREGRRA
jgi:hypothetical protein